jgi:hypothetical protein
MRKIIYFFALFLLFSCQSEQEKLEEEFLRDAPQLVEAIKSINNEKMYALEKNYFGTKNYLIDIKFDSSKLKSFNKAQILVKNSEKLINSLDTIVKFIEKKVYDEVGDKFHPNKNFYDKEYAKNVINETNFTKKIKSNFNQYTNNIRKFENENKVQILQKLKVEDFEEKYFDDLPLGLCLLKIHQLIFEIIEIEEKRVDYELSVLEKQFLMPTSQTIIVKLDSSLNSDSVGLFVDVNNYYLVDSFFVNGQFTKTNNGIGQYFIDKDLTHQNNDLSIKIETPIKIFFGCTTLVKKIDYQTYKLNYK